VGTRTRSMGNLKRKQQSVRPVVRRCRHLSKLDTNPRVVLLISHNGKLLHIIKATWSSSEIIKILTNLIIKKKKKLEIKIFQFWREKIGDSFSND